MKHKIQFPAPIEDYLLQKRTREGYKSPKERFGSNLIELCKQDGLNVNETQKIYRIRQYLKNEIKHGT